MVTRYIVVSDLSGEPDAATVSIGVDSEWRAIDLTQTEHAKLNDLLRPYLAASRQADPAAQKPRRNIPKTTREERVAIRRWGSEHGFEVANRGVIPKTVYRAYQDAHPDDPS